uniref:Uncharacterized protein n=1 Tax=Ralstonia solanacearum TaxID=305 RepID=A0A0S4TQ84_RALSL|nr:conserved protein of unknown function [Ralstonia solanacearum]
MVWKRLSTLVTVHPRMRGEHTSGVYQSNSVIGSSPHARGTPRSIRRTHRRERFIPACAGNTSRFDWIAASQAVHPRMRGEHHQHYEYGLWNGGSSPHARGTQTGPLPQPAWLRFIPACAGNTPSGRACRRPPAVHPRMRGEHRIISIELAKAGGSSPHARGTPACSLAHATTSTVHPRMRGEHVRIAFGCLDFRGSSPHARGTLGFYESTKIPSRFIPACAGNTTAGTSRTTSAPVHPRMRGEHGVLATISTSLYGSSPHARGTPRPPRRRCDPNRFIPACAGNTVVL